MAIQTGKSKLELTGKDRQKAKVQKKAQQLETGDSIETLRKARVRQGLTIEELCSEMGLTRSRLEALESNNFGQLPVGIYTRGYIKRYCALLNIDPAPVLESYARYSGELNEEVQEATLGEKSRDVMSKGFRPPVLLTALALALLLLWLVQPGAPEGGIESRVETSQAVQVNPHENMAVAGTESAIE